MDQDLNHSFKVVKLPTATEAIILQMLFTGKSMYGLEMVSTSDYLDRRTIYIVLGRMVGKRFITTSKKVGNLKRYYEITEFGKKTYKAWTDFMKTVNNETQRLSA